MDYNLLRSPPPPLNRNAEWAILRTISYSLPRGHGIPSSYTRLNRQRKALHSVCLLATHVRAVGGHPLQWGGSYLRIKRYSRTGCGGAIHSNGGQLSPDQAAPLGLLPPEYEARGASYSGVKRPGGDLLRGAISSVTVPRAVVETTSTPSTAMVISSGTAANPEKISLKPGKSTFLIFT